MVLVFQEILAQLGRKDKGIYQGHLLCLIILYLPSVNIAPSPLWVS